MYPDNEESLKDREEDELSRYLEMVLTPCGALDLASKLKFVNHLSLGTLSNSVFRRRASTGSGLFASLGTGLVKTLG